MVDGMTDTEIRFERPPVRSVELTLYFDQVGLKLTALAPLLSTLTESFPDVTERFAQMPWGLENSNELPPLIEEGSTTFPFPSLTFANSEGHSISFQGDRLQLRWEFGEERTYPGYIQLRDALAQEFERFTAHVGESTGEDVHVKRVRAEYENTMSTRIAWSVAQRARGIDDNTDPQRIEGLGRLSSGGKFTFTDGELETAVDFAAVSHEDAGRLSLRGTTAAGDDVLDALAALDVAHGHLLDCFATLTTSEQHDSWGEK